MFERLGDTFDPQVIVVSLLWLAFLAVLGVGLYFYQRNFAPFASEMPKEEEAETILNQRLARGEITRAEYEELLDEIRG